MNLREFYVKIGGDYEMLMAAFRTEEKAIRFLKRYAEEPSYQRLCDAAQSGNIREAFEAVHAMKGVTGMFYLTRLYEAVVCLVEQLRTQKEPMDMELFSAVQREQEQVLSLLKELDG